MQIGVGLDSSLGLTWDENRQLAREAAQQGYTSIWTNSSPNARDPFQTCVQWWAASAEATPGGVHTGIAVVPAPTWTPTTLASAAGTANDITGGRFILGVGSGSVYNARYRATWGIPDVPILRLTREYVTTLRELLAGQTVTRDGSAVHISGVKLAYQPPPTPVYLAALGPQMMRLAGEIADGVSLNWCSAEQIGWSRDLLAAGAAKANRDPKGVTVAEYIRICVDDDENAARLALARATLGYALNPPGAPKENGYRGHFGRMGFEAALIDLEARRDAGAKPDELAERFPADLLLKVGYFGKAAGAAAAFQRLAQGLDTAIVRVVPARAGADSVRAVMQACAPKRG
jgi:alkanesulfonate monooxygenase SsuD/methylene tetrahydromethanopterin reductase-like flavin-dependent oxidoreductase (luciferase family)